MSCCAPSRPHSPPPAPAVEPDAGQKDARRGSPCSVVRIPGGRSFVGTDFPEISQDGEGPERAVILADFGLEAEAVTVARFSEFVTATGYVTEAERFGWSAVFSGSRDGLPGSADEGFAMPWWHKVDGASWRAPEGDGSTVLGRETHPVTQISWADANAFSAWVGGRLPSEAEWEHAARGGAVRRRFPWGEAEPSDETIYANIWQGSFPAHNSARDGYLGTAPVRSFEPNPLGLYNMSGNVWEWTRDNFKVRSLSRMARKRNADALAHGEKVLKGGSFLCHRSYCYRYRIAARMALAADSASSNTGFRIAYDL